MCGIHNSIDEKLMQNGFEYYDDWEYGPSIGWSKEGGFYSINLMRHGYGYWLILEHAQGGGRSSINIGSSDNADDILAFAGALNKLK